MLWVGLFGTGQSRIDQFAERLGIRGPFGKRNLDHLDRNQLLRRETWPAWLGEEPTDPPKLKALLAPYPSERMTCWPVSARVGNVKNNDASLLEPLLAVSSVG